VRRNAGQLRLADDLGLDPASVIGYALGSDRRPDDLEKHVGFDPDSATRLCYASAGHNPATLLRASGEIERLAATGLPLGLLPVGDYAREERMLSPGDTIVLYTDGITEAANRAGEEYGLERLIELCRAEFAGGVAKLAVALQQDLDSFAEGVPFGDDRTLVLRRRLE
jgi:phosphoserine phosphatase RsbU/P